jgi:hypothetical protein
VIPVDEQRVLVKCRRATLTVTVKRVHLAQIDGPIGLAAHVQGEQAARAEGDEQALAVCDRRGGREAAGDVRALVRPLGTQDALPQDLAVPTVERQDHEVQTAFRKHVVVRSVGMTALAHRTVSLRHGGGDEDPTSPDDRGRVSAPGNRDLPAQVLALTPGERRVAVRRHSGRPRSAPLAPLVLGVRAVPGGGGCCHRQQREQHRCARGAGPPIRAVVDPEILHAADCIPGGNCGP